MEEILNKIPNWLRYILAIPGAIIFTVLIYLLNLLFLGYASPDSLIVQLLPWTFGSFIKIIAFGYAFSYILPKYQFELTIAISSLYVGFYTFAIILLWRFDNLEFGSIISFLLIITACIISCYIAYSKYGISRVNQRNINNETIQDYNPYRE